MVTINFMLLHVLSQIALKCS
ncbi:unnamed protein product [Cuscuta europaea]|uniref:Uncharacterized protein n=1 Tax=Cuscuta europaea TaxID=41803 RepID=A0A9P1EH75_CUSEU|nr:unnamed protein product [Cuscuta europaea]